MREDDPPKATADRSAALTPFAARPLPGVRIRTAVAVPYRGVVVADVAFVVLTIVVFAVLALCVKGAEKL